MKSVFELILSFFKTLINTSYPKNTNKTKEKRVMKEITIEDKLLSMNEWSRGGEKLKGVKAIVLHWTGAPKQDAHTTWQFFENRKLGKDGYGSAHYIVGQSGEIIRCIPDDEQSYHAGSTEKDPVSGKIYTDESRTRFGTKPDGNGYCPNSWSIGIEMATVDANGEFNSETLESTERLVATLLNKYNLGIDAVTTHHNLVGWKDCPRLWVNNPEKFEEFKKNVAIKLNYIKNGESYFN